MPAPFVSPRIGRTAHGHSRCRTLPAIAAIALMFASAAATAQTTYWLGRINGTEYVFDIPMPTEFAVKALTANPAQYMVEKSPRELPPRTVNGQRYEFVSGIFVYDVPMLGRGTIAAERRPGTKDLFWVAGATPFAAQLPVPAAGTWESTNLVFLIAPDPKPPAFTVPVPPMTLARVRMREIGQQTQPGAFFPGVKAPADLDGYRREMLAYGNVGRRDPDFRKRMGSQTATDLSADTVSVYADQSKTRRQIEKVFKQSPTPPYFKDHVLNARLNDAAQFQAEYNASINSATHTGPSSYRDPRTGKTVNLAGLGQRREHFQFDGMVVEGAGESGLGGAPHNWMQSDTHFRPFFNVDGCYPQIGYGAAQSANGKWYFIMVPEADRRPDCATRPVAAADPSVAATTAAPPSGTQVTQAQQPAPTMPTAPTRMTVPQATENPPAPTRGPPALAPSPPPPARTTPQPTSATQPPPPVVPAADALPLRAGTALAQNRRYRSESGQHYLVFQPDGNLVVYDAANRYVWGLDKLPNFQQIRTVDMQPDGNLVARGPNGSFIWSALSRNPDPSALLSISPGGALQLVSSRTGGILWSSDGRTAAAPTQPTAAPPAGALQGEFGKQYAVPEGQTFRYVVLNSIHGTSTDARGTTTYRYRVGECPVRPGSVEVSSMMRVEDALARGLTPSNAPCNPVLVPNGN